MKKEHTTKNPLKKLSLQWRLTLIITLLMTVTCVLMYFLLVTPLLPESKIWVIMS